MVCFVPTDELEVYISSITLDFSGNINNVYCQNLEKERQRNTRLAIIALFKLYRNIPLTPEEQEMLDAYPLETNLDQKFEKCIAFIAFKIGQEFRNMANSAKNTFADCIFMLGSSDSVTASLDEVKKDIWQYIERLDEYNKSLVHAYVYDHEINLITPERKDTKPSIDYSGEYFICENMKTKDKTTNRS